MRFDILTLFPQMFAPFLENGVTRRAYASGPGAKCICGIRATLPRATTAAWMTALLAAALAW